VVSSIATLELDKVAVKERTRPSKIYTFLDMLGGEKTPLTALEDRHKAFLATYRSQERGQGRTFDS
jgi:hypothetical protein